jgi:pimeloyl-ACP methyl ester carboxylesterase
VKKLLQYFARTFLLIILLIVAHEAEAMMLAPVFDLTVIVNTIEGEAKLDFKLRSQDPNNIVADDVQSFSIQTVDQTGAYQAEVVVSDGGEIYLVQKAMADWKILEVYCTSLDPVVTSSLYSDSFGHGVKIAAKLYSSMTCTFTAAKITPKKNPIILIPGILSSHLSRNDDEKSELWPNIKKALFGLPGDKYLDELALNQIGQPNLSYPVVLPTDIFRKINDHDFFDGLIQKLKTEGYEEGEDLFVFPYDWRLDIRQTVDGLYSPVLTSLKDKIGQILTQTGSEKVDIIAHSMGGLLAKYYIGHYGQDKVDKFIDIATPHLGAPSAFKTLMWGDDMGIKFGFLGLNTDEVKKIVQNMPSAYQLLPSENYFSSSSPEYKYYVYNEKRLSYDETLDLLKSSGRNDYVLDRASNIHNDLDLMNPVDFGVKAYNIVGCGVPTIAKFFNLGQENYDVSYTSGDGTVPEKSSRNFPAIEEYQVTNTNHSSLPSREGVSSLVSKILANNVEDYTWTDFEYVSTSTPVCNLPDGEIMSFHGPVRLDHYEYGAEMMYDYIDNNTFIFLPLVSEEKIKLVATKSGRANAHIKKFRDSQVISTAYFSDITLKDASSTIEINLDAEEPRINDLLPSVTVAGDSLRDLDPPVTSVSIASGATSTTVQFVTQNDDVLKTKYSVNNEEYITGTSTIITNLGTTTIHYHSVDNSGNVEDIREVDIYLDPPPTTSTSTTNSSHRRKESRSLAPSKEVSQKVEPIVVQNVIEVIRSASTSKQESYVEKETAEENFAELTEIESLNFAAVVESGLEGKKFHWWIIVLVVLVILALTFSKKIMKRVK